MVYIIDHSSGQLGFVAGLAEMGGCDTNQMDCGGDTLLMWAVKSRYPGVVEILLGQGDANLDKPDNDGQTPLW